jgi:hypothetical protein
MDLPETSKPVLAAGDEDNTSKPSTSITAIPPLSSSQFIPPPLERSGAQLVLPPQRVDGRKRPRTEAQLLATKLMKENRHKTFVIPQVLERETETIKDEKRKKKLGDIDELISKRMDTYHAKLLEELGKPLTGFLDKYIDDNYSDDDTSSVVVERHEDKRKENEAAEIKEETAFPGSGGSQQWGKQSRTSWHGTAKQQTFANQRRKFL